MPDIDLDLEPAIERMGDKELFLEIAHSFAATLPRILTDLDGKLMEGSLADARRLAHSLKSNCAAMGAESVRAMAYAVEKACTDNDGALAREHFNTLKPYIESLQQRLSALA
ncbi:Hpt domain-containing protein [Desulfovibrio sp. OttesenSCG-928-I05]|nr:Hpt domain-containing protein [Desulfovibrio sp. OttesenSCG-928-I05]